MRLVTVYAPGAGPRPLLAAYRAHLDRTGRSSASHWWAARDFFSRWPDPAMWAAEPLEVRLSASCAHRPVITFLMIHGHLRPGYDYLLERKISSLWRELGGTALGEDLARVLDAAAQLGFSERVAAANASQVPARLLTQAGRRLGEPAAADLDELAAAGREREQRTGQGWRHYQSGISFTHRVLFHLGVLTAPPETGPKPVPFADRLAGVTPAIAAAMTSCLNLKLATCKPKTVSSLATRLTHFGRFLTAADPGLASLAGLDRQRHIEPYLASAADAADSRTGTAITPENSSSGSSRPGTSSPIVRLVRGFRVGAGGGVPCGLRVRTGRGWSGRCGGRAARGGPRVLPFVLAVPASGRVKGEVPSAVAGGAGGDGDEVAADGGGAGLRVQRAGQCPGGAQQVLRDGGDDRPDRVRGETAGWEMGERPFVPVGEGLLDDGVAAVLVLGLERLERRVGVHGVAAPGGEQLALPSGCLLIQGADAGTISRAVTCSSFFFEVNAVYPVSATSASKTQRPACSSQIARG